MGFSITRNTKALARHLLACEEGGGCDAIINVSEKLRASLGSVLGVVGFRTLLQRALLLTNTDIGTMETMSVRIDGKLAGLEEFAARSTRKQIDDGGEALISRLLVLAEIFLGEALTRTLIEEIWPMTNPDTVQLKINNP
jgi:hypothetical protein